MAAPPRRTRLPALLLCLAVGAVLFLWQLGSTGLVDETPPLFAASARGMVERGDWLIPHVNGLPRYDKPPLVYWLMALLYALPGQPHWDPLGSWAAALPSALASIAVMLGLADTLLRWPQPPLRARPGTTPDRTAAAGAPQIAPQASPSQPTPAGQPTPTVRPEHTAVAAALAFGLCPLVLLWGRIPVSDALLTSLLSLALLSFWRRWADPAQPWQRPWLLLGLAVLCKGPVAVVLSGLTLLLFNVLQGEGRALWRRLRLRAGLGLTALVSLPWYLLALLRDGQPFWDSFFGYHNLQRFSTVVNQHLQPWWFFLPLLLLAALPVSPLLLLALVRAIGPLQTPLRLATARDGGHDDHPAAAELASAQAAPEPASGADRAAGWGRRQLFAVVRRLPGRIGAARFGLDRWPAEQSLARFAASWLLAVLLFFTAAATKLPSYWLPATPAAALLVALIAQVPWGEPSSGRRQRHRAAAATPAAVPEPAPAAVNRRSASVDQAARIAWNLSLLLAVVVALAFALGPFWVPLIQDPELPTLPAELLASGLLSRACWLWGLAAALGWLARARQAPLRLLALQLPLILVVPAVLLPAWALGDRLRSLPVRQMAAAVQRRAAADEPVAMIGILKPSLHFYSHKVVIYERGGPDGLVNLADRLQHERRPGLRPSSPQQQPTVLVVIDQLTAIAPLWRGLAPRELARSGPYRLWRLDRRRLEQRAAAVMARGQAITWSLPRPERF
ncbi:MAG: glycosyltransferase family 39 protein [Synechococcus sp.]|nr:glycosyltransferase family 39 protein [Synechococcus sp.]